MRSQAEPDYVDEILNFADEREIGEGQKIREIKMNFINQHWKLLSQRQSFYIFYKKITNWLHRAARIIDMMEDEGL